MAHNCVAVEEPSEVVAEGKHSRGWEVLVVWPALAFLVYVLSSGPVVRWDKPLSTSRTWPLIEAFYRPIAWAYTSTPLHKPLGMYFHLWDPTVFGKDGEPTFGSVH